MPRWSGLAHRTRRLRARHEGVAKRGDPGDLGMDIINPEHRSGDAVIPQGRLPGMRRPDEWAVRAP